MSITNLSGIGNIVTKLSQHGKQILVKFIPINVGYGVIKNIPINKNTGLLYDLHQDIIHDEPYDLMQFLTTRSQWSSSIDETSVTIYVNFLLGNKVNVIDRDILLSCFVIYSLLEDSNFFNYLIEQLLQRWTLLSQVLYNSEQYSLPDDVKEDIFLCIPDMLIPNKYLSDTIFMTKWLAKHDKQTITLNHNEIFETTQHEQTVNNRQYNAITNSHYDNSIIENVSKSTYIEPTSVDDKHNGGNMIEYIILKRLNTDTQTHTDKDETVIEKRYNGYIEGRKIQSFWDSDDNDEQKHKHKQIHTFIKGQRMGPQLSYYDDNLYEETYIEKGVCIGNATVYYDNGQIKVLTHYNLNRKGITVTAYLPNGELDYIESTKKDNNNNWYTDYATKYLPDGGVIESNQNDALFYDVDKHLTRKITNPYPSQFHLPSKIQHDIRYDQQGETISSVELSPGIVLDLTSDTYPYMYYHYP